MLVTFVLLLAGAEATVFVAGSSVSGAVAAAPTGTSGLFVSAAGTLLDTRHGTGGYSTPMPAGAWRSVQVTGVAGIPSSGVSAVLVTATAVNQSGLGILSGKPDGGSAASTVLIYSGSSAMSNDAILAVSAAGKIAFQAQVATDLLVRVEGYYTAGKGTAAPGGFVPVTPTRLVDTRVGTGAPKARLADGQSLTVQVSGNASIPAGAIAAAVTVTAVTPSVSGWLYDYAADASPVNTLNFPASDTAISAQVDLSAGGAFILKDALAKTDVVVDVVGYFAPVPAGSSAGAFTPAAGRLYDSSTSTAGSLAANEVRVIQIAGLNGVPAAGSGIGAVTLNVQVVSGNAADENLSVWADGTPFPGTSEVNTYGTARSNMVTVAMGANGAIDVRNSSAHPVRVVLDLQGWYNLANGPIGDGHTSTQQSVTLQGVGATTTSGWVGYQYRNGTTGDFTAVPSSDVSPAPGGAGSSWPEQGSGSGASASFPAHTWNLQSTLGLTNAVVQVQACYYTSASDSSPVCSMPVNITYSPATFGNSKATSSVGPGSLALVTGDYQISATDASAATSLGGLSVGRTLTTLAPAAATSTAAGAFGPGWTADLTGPDAGNAALTVSDQSAKGYVVFTDTDGSASMYQATTAVSSYPIVFTGAGDAAGDGEVVKKTGASLITMTDEDNTVTTWTKTGAGVWQASSVAQPGSNTTSSYVYTGTGLVSRILAPTPAGVSCTDTTADTTPGCRSLLLYYTCVAGQTRLTTIAESLPQTAGTSNKITVEAYVYDSNARLVAAYDPRITPALKTAYSYDSNGRLATLTPPGLAAYSFSYNSAGQLVTISRPVTVAGAAQTATTTIIYNLPLSGSGLPTLTAATAASWGQTSDPAITGTAIFGPEHVPAGTTAAAVSSSDWPWADLHYLDVNGREVNTASYGAGAWQIGTSSYDTNGNTVWTLSAGNRAQALNSALSAASPGSLDSYVASQSAGAARANLLASTTIYNPLDPSQVTDTYGPTHPIQLTDGTTVHGRAHENTTYDEGAPNSDVNPATGQAYGLATTSTTTIWVIDPGTSTQSAGTDTSWPDAQITHTGYAPVVSGDPSGGDLAAATSSTVQMASAPSSGDLTSYTRYDASGRAIETRLPGDSGGSTPRTTDTAYFTATGSGSCVNAPLAGVVCRTGPGGQPSTGAPLPVTTTSYDQYGNQTSTTETYGSGASQVVRTSTTSYDSGERPLTSSVTVTPSSAGGVAVPTVTTSYTSTTGLTSTVSTGSGSSTQTLTSAYDTVGNVVSYTDATGAVTTTGYDIAGRVVSVNTGKQNTTYSYDTSSEHRGEITGEDIGAGNQPSSFTASYDASGALSSETYPNGLVASTSYDNAGNATALSYTKNSSTWMGFTQTAGLGDRTVAQTSTLAGSAYSKQGYTFDGDGRLTGVQDTYQGACTTRTYAFDTDSNRTSLTSNPAASGGACSTSTTAASTSYSYDGADRLTSDTAGAYSYDQLGRTLTVPAADAKGIGAHASITGTATIGYYANDLVNTESQGSTSLAFTLDPDQSRVLTQSDGTTTTTSHYNNDDDTPAWTSTSATAWTANITGPDGNLAATLDQTGAVTLQLPNLHGDLAATCPDATTATAVSGYNESTEYGVPRNAATAPTTYGWLGAKQRSTNDLAGLTLMGVRLYNPATGRFLQTDPVPGGSAGPYLYPTDPINQYDLTGQWWHWHHHWHMPKWAKKTGRWFKHHWRGVT